MATDHALGAKHEYTLLLAEDERIEREAFRIFIARNFPSIRQLDDATDGAEALRMAKALSPDIMVVDINMPNLNGIKAIRALREDGFIGSIIIRTAYSQFQYAYEALSLAIDSFILKPTKERVLIDAIQGCINNVEAHRVNQRAKEESTSKLQEMRALVEADLIEAIVSSDHESCATRISSYLRVLDFDALEGLFMRAKIDDAEAASMGDKGRTELDSMLILLQNVARETAGRYSRAFIGHADADAMSFPLLIIREGISNDLLGDLSLTIAREALSRMIEFHGISVRIGIGCPAVGLDELRSSYFESERNLHDTGRKNPIIAPDEDGSKARCDIRLFRERMERILTDITDLSDYRFASILPQIEDMISDSAEGAAPLRLFDLSFTTIEALSRRGAINEKARVTLVSQIRNEIDGIQDPGVAKERIFDKFRQFTQESKRGKATPKEQVVDRAISYIRSYFMDNLSLDDVSAAINVSPCYLSHLFSQELSMTFVAYMTDVRIKQALKLINAGQYSIRELSALVGYRNPSYFSKKFRESTGHSVSEVYERVKAKEDRRGSSIVAPSLSTSPKPPSA